MTITAGSPVCHHYQSLDSCKSSQSDYGDSVKSAEAGSGAVCRPIPHRYWLGLMGCLALLLTIGTRAFFALVLTHITATDVTQRSNDLIFSDCSADNVTGEGQGSLDGQHLFLLHTAYFVGCFCTAVPASVLATCFSPVRLIGLTMLANSGLTLLMPLVIAQCPTLLFPIRVLQGILEGGQQPVLVGLISVWATPADKASLTSILFTGLYTAPAMAFVLTSICLCYISWGTIFYLYGSLGVLWCTVWLSQFYDTPQLHPRLSKSDLLRHNSNSKKLHASTQFFSMLRTIPWRSILRSWSVWSIFVANLCRCFVFSALVVEQPQYFSDAFNIHTTDIGILAMVSHLGLGAMCLVGGVLSDRLLHWGLSVTNTRKLAYTAGSLAEGVCLLGLHFAEQWTTAFLLLTVGLALGGLATSGYLPLAADMSPQYAGVVTGLAQLATVGAVISTLLASAITGTHRTRESWQKLFLIAGCLQMTCLVIFNFCADGRPQSWGDPAHTLTRTPTPVSTPTSESALSASPTPTPTHTPTTADQSEDDDLDKQHCREGEGRRRRREGGGWVEGDTEPKETTRLLGEGWV